MEYRESHDLILQVPALTNKALTNTIAASGSG